MKKYYYITFLGPLGEDDISLMFHDVAEDIFFISNCQAIIKSNKCLLDIKDEANLTNPDAPEFVLFDVSNINNLQVYCQGNSEFERYLAEITPVEPSQKDIDSVLDKISKYGEKSLTPWDLKILDYRSQVVGS